MSNLSQLERVRFFAGKLLTVARHDPEIHSERTFSGVEKRKAMEERRHRSTRSTGHDRGPAH